MNQATILFAIGLLGGFSSGVLGIGGGIVLAPLLLYALPLFGRSPLDMKTVSGLTMVQSCAASLTAGLIHRKFRHVHTRLVVYIGVPMALSSFSGAALSKLVDSRALLVLFAAMAVAAAGLMFVPKRQHHDVPLEQVRFHAGTAIGSAVLLGALGGLVGQTGSFLLIPFMIYILGIPTRIAVGSSLGIVLCAGVFGALGKIIADQVRLPLALPLVPGALLGAYAGGELSRRVPTRALRYGVGLVSGLTAARILYDLSEHSSQQIGSG